MSGLERLPGSYAGEETRQRVGRQLWPSLPAPGLVSDPRRWGGSWICGMAGCRGRFPGISCRSEVLAEREEQQHCWVML